MIDSLKDEICTTAYAPQLNWNWRTVTEVVFVNGFELYVRLELSRSSYFDFKCYLGLLICMYKNLYKV